MNARFVLAWLRAIGASRTVYAAVGLYCVAVGSLDPDTAVGQALFGAHGLFDVRLALWGHIVDARTIAATLLFVAVVACRAGARGPFAATVEAILDTVLGNAAGAPPSDPRPGATASSVPAPAAPASLSALLLPKPKEDPRA